MPVAIAPPVPPVPAPDDVEAADWKLEIGNWESLPEADLTTATNRSVTWRLTGNHEANFTVDGMSDEAALINEILTDVWFSRNGQVLYRGAVGASSDDMDPDTHSAQFSSADYRSWLTRRFLVEGDSLVYADMDQADIAWRLVNLTQSKPGGTMHIGRGTTHATGVRPPTQVFPVGTSIADLLIQLGQGDTGFDWDITPYTGTVNQTFDIWYPQRGTDRQEVIDFPGKIQKLSRTFDPSTFANVLRGSGADGLAARNVTAPGITTSGVRRFEQLFSDTDIATVSALTARTNTELANSQTPTASWTATLAADAWRGPNHIWLGDPVILAVTEGRHAGTVESLRVQEITVTLDDDSDSATAQITLGQPKPNRKWRLVAFDRRLSAIEKR